mgnify:CR=1 FL=1
MRFAASPGFLGAYGLADTFDPNQLGQQAALGRSTQNRAATAADAAVRGQELQADATIQAAKYGADATRAQGAAQGQMSMMQGAMGALGSIGSQAFSNMNTFQYNRTPFGAGGGVMKDPQGILRGTLGPNYGISQS